jgi:inorganic pyrophosphatase
MQSLIFVLLGLVASQSPAAPPRELPAQATAQLAASLAASRAHASHLWRDSAPVNADGTVNAYIEIPRGGLEKFEFDMKANTVAVDRVMPASIGGYPVNYGIVPQTVSYDGDPFDALVLGAPLASGTMVRGVIVGLMHMEDEKGLDSKVVLAVPNADGTPSVALTDADKARIGGYFARYKEHEPGKFSRVPGWGSAEEGRAFVTAAHAFFRECAAATGACVPPSLSKR